MEEEVELRKGGAADDRDIAADPPALLASCAHDRAKRSASESPDETKARKPSVLEGLPGLKGARAEPFDDKRPRDPCADGFHQRSKPLQPFQGPD